MFRRFPLFENLISWTHEAEPDERQTREYEARDQNSLVADEPELRALVPEHMGEGRHRPGAAGDGGRGSPRSRNARESVCATDAAGSGRAATTPASSSSRATASTRAAPPCSPSARRSRGCRRSPASSSPTITPRSAAAPGASRASRVVIIGKRNSAFEVGEGLLRQGVRELTLVSPRPADTAKLARSPLRPWYLTPYDEHARGAPGRYVLDASIDHVERTTEA